MQTRQVRTSRLLASAYLFSLIACLIVVFVLNSRTEGFHGFVPTLAKETILSLRTALASLAIFTFFLLIWVLNRRGTVEAFPQWVKWTIASLALAESPAFYGLILFLLKGAFKTFFAFFALSVLYMIVAWPRSEKG